MRVIPDVDANAERSEKQKAECSKFGFLSGLLNSIYPYIKIGYPKVYQPLNFCIKQNLDFVLQNNGEFSFNYKKLSFSKGILETALTDNIVNYQLPSTSEHTIRIKYYNSGVGKYSLGAKIYAILYFVESKTILARLCLRNREYGNYGLFIVNKLEEYKFQHVHLFYFFEQNKETSNTMYAGTLLYK